MVKKNQPGDIKKNPSGGKKRTCLAEHKKLHERSLFIEEIETEETEAEETEVEETETKETETEKTGIRKTDTEENRFGGSCNA